MKKIVLRPVEGGQKSVELKIGKTIIGRGPLLECSDKKVSRNHAVLEVTEDGEVFLTPTHVNPCFYQAQGKGPSKVMKKDKQQLLQSGDSIALLPNSYKYIVEIINSSTSSISADLKESRPADDGDKDSIAEKPATAVIPSEEARKNGSTEENHHPTATTVAAKTENGDRGSSKEASPEAVSKATPTVRKSAGGGALANKGDDGESKSSTGGTRTLPRWLLDSAAKSATTATSVKAKASSVQKDKKDTGESATPKKAGRAMGKAPATKARGRQAKESESEAEEDEPDQKSEDDAEDEEDDESEEEYEPKRKKMPEQAERRSVTGSGANRKGSRSSRQNRGLMQKISLDDFIASDDDQWDNSSDEWKPKKRRKQVDDSGSDWEEENRRTKKVTRYAASDSDSASDWERASRRKKPATRTRNRRKRSSSESGSSEESAPVRRGQRRQPAKRPSCKYGRKCFRKNAQHVKQFSHPKDSDYEGSSGDEDEDDSKDRADGSDAESSSDRGKRPTKRPSAADTSKRRAKHREEESDDEDDDGSGDEDDRPMCRYGKECFRKNAQHLKNFKHPPSTPSKKKEPVKQTSKKAKSRGKAKGSSEEEEASGDEYEWKDDEDDAKKSNEEDSSSEQKKATPAKRKRAAERRAAPAVNDDDD